MEKLLETAKQKVEQAEVYFLEENINLVQFENARLKDIETSLQSGFSLRIIKDNKLGFAYTRNLNYREGLIRNALATLKANVKASFEFPLNTKQSLLDTYNPAIEKVTSSVVVEECNRIADILSSKTKGQVNLRTAFSVKTLKLINNKGTDLSLKTSNYFIYATVLYPNSYAAIHRILSFKNFEKAPDDYLDFLSSLYNRSAKEIKPQSGRMKVLFMPETVYVLMWRFRSATSGEAVYQRESPLIGKINEKIFSEKITIVNDPLNEKFPEPRPFDDEGTSCIFFPLVENGILKNYYFDLDYANKMNVKPTGHGFKSAQWSSEKIALKPTPSLQHLYIQPGAKSFSELLKSIDKGIIIAGALGAHSGNILNGDFSIGLSPGIYVENGEIAGYVKDAMVAGNIYQILQNVVDLEDEVHFTIGGMFPAVLIDDVSVVIKNR